MSLVIFQPHASLQTLNTLGVNAQAALLYTLTDIAALPALLSDTRVQQGPRLVLGGGSNMVFTRDFPGVVLKVALRGIRIVAEHDDHVCVEAAAGEPWHAFVQYTLARGWFGLENLSLIPGTVGAAPIQNIGAYGVEIKNVIEQVSAVRFDNGHMLELSAQDCQFGYRDSVFKHALRDCCLITAVRFRLSKQPVLHIEYGDIRRALSAQGISQPRPLDVAEIICNLRRSKLPDPKELGNVGSFFKNPVIAADDCTRLLASYPDLVHYPQADGRSKIAAGWLIERAGLKGYVMGNAAVHARQALVLVNCGHASGAEIYALAQMIQAKVTACFGVTLEIEPLVI